MSELSRADAIKNIQSIRDYMQDRIENETDIAFDKEQAIKDVASLDVAINSLRIDEQYDLMYEQVEPTVAQERYEDLCEYFGSAKDILKNREDFKAWLDRIKWHIRKAEELYEKYEVEPTDWIPVSERLPKAYQKVLVTYEEFHWANEPATYGVKVIPFGGRVDFIAWMPLPKPYKAESEEENDNR